MFVRSECRSGAHPACLLTTCQERERGFGVASPFESVLPLRGDSRYIIAALAAAVDFVMTFPTGNDSPPTTLGFEIASFHWVHWLTLLWCSWLEASGGRGDAGG